MSTETTMYSLMGREVVQSCLLSFREYAFENTPGAMWPRSRTLYVAARTSWSRVPPGDARATLACCRLLAIDWSGSGSVRGAPFSRTVTELASLASLVLLRNALYKCNGTVGQSQHPSNRELCRSAWGVSRYSCGRHRQWDFVRAILLSKDLNLISISYSVTLMFSLDLLNYL